MNKSWCDRLRSDVELEKIRFYKVEMLFLKPIILTASLSAGLFGFLFVDGLMNSELFGGMYYFFLVGVGLITSVYVALVKLTNFLFWRAKIEESREVIRSE